MKKIISFEGKYRFLSNFSDHPVTYQGITYRNSEAAFQAQKCPARATEFATLSPNDAKRLGRKVKLRPDWEAVKDGIMLEILRCKFHQNCGIRELLLTTDGLYLEEGNTWGDRYWGTVKGVGQNKLGLLLMRVRTELIDETELEEN